MNANLNGPSRVFAGMAVAASLCCAPAAVAEESAPPNILIVEASQLIRAAEDARAPEEKIPLLESARAKLQSVIDNHPASDLALKLATRQAIGAISLPAVDRALETALEGCWNSPTVDCVSRLVLDHAESSGDCEIQLGAYVALADASIALGKLENAASAMKRVEELDGFCNAHRPDVILFESSVAALSSIVARDLSAEQVAGVSELIALDKMASFEHHRLVRGLGENGFFATAAEIAAAAVEDYGQRDAQFELALARGKHGLTSGEDGVESFGAAKRIAAQAENALEGAELLVRIAWEQVNSNAPTDALATATAAEELALGLANDGVSHRRRVNLLVDVARMKARATGNKTDAQPVLLQAIERASRLRYPAYGPPEYLAYNSLWLTPAGTSVPESLLRLMEQLRTTHASSESSPFAQYTCPVWAAVHSAYGRLGNPMAAFRALEAHLSRTNFEWEDWHERGETHNCVGKGVMIASFVEQRHDALPNTFNERMMPLRLLDLLRLVPDYPLDDRAIAVLIDDREADSIRRAIEHQFKAGFTRQARSLAQQVTEMSATGFDDWAGLDARPEVRDVPGLVRFQLLFGMPRQAEALLGQELAGWRKDCLTASAEDGCHGAFRHLLTSAAILEGATAR